MKAMNTHFLAKLGEFFRMNRAAIEASELTPEEIADVFKKSRAHAGGKQKAENQKMSMSEQFGRDSGDWRLFFEREFAEAPATIQVLPRPGKYNHPRYGEFVITSKDLQAFVGNHNNHVYQEQVPIDAEHQSKLSGAIGYYREMRLIDAGKGGAEADVEWTDRGRELIASDSFKYFSPEWFDAWTDPASNKKISNVLVGGAITTRPFFKDKVLRPLVAGPTSYIAGEWEGEGEEPKTLIMSAMQFTEEEPEENSKKANLDTGDVHVNKPMMKPGGDDEDEHRDDEKKDKGGKQMADDPKVVDDVTKAFVEEQTKQLTEKLGEEQGLRKAAEERLAKLETQAQTRRFNDIITGRDAEGDGSPPFPGEHAPHLTMMALVAKEFGEESEQFKVYIAQQRSIAKQMREAGLFQEAGASGGGTQVGARTAKKQFDEAVTAWMEANPGKNKGDAVQAVSDAQPNVYAEYIKEGNKRAATSGTSYGYEEEGQ